MKKINIGRVIPEKISGIDNDFSDLRIVKKKHYEIQKDMTMTGAAPKEFVKIYEYEQGIVRSGNVSSWPSFIVKSSQKYYPIESVIERLNNDIGILLSFNMAECQLLYINEQIRFGSKYFLKKNEELLHGADLFAGYLNSKMLEEIESEKLDKTFFNVHYIFEVLKHKFVDSYRDIFASFVDMLLLDAFIGVNDRHQYNWGVIRNIQGEKNARFSPIYDTARSLLWNHDEQKLYEKQGNPLELKRYLKKYNLNSRPKIGWDGKLKLNHFEMVNLIYNCDLIDVKERIKKLGNNILV